MTITPMLAQKMLDTSIGNRPINSRKVALFAQDMADGEWNDFAPSIYFDENNQLLDGHTRLNAVIKSGATIKIDVVRGFPRAEWNKLNTASGWSAGEFAAANGVKDPNTAMSAIKTREALKRGLTLESIWGQSKVVKDGRMWTNDDFLRLYKADPEWQDDVEYAMSLWRQWHGISASMCAGVMRHLIKDRGWPRDFVREFFHQCYTLEGITANARTLRKRIDIDRVSGNRLKTNYICLLISKAFDGYVANTPKNKLQVNDIHAPPKFPRMNRKAT